VHLSKNGNQTILGNSDRVVLWKFPWINEFIYFHGAMSWTILPSMTQSLSLSYMNINLSKYQLQKYIIAKVHRLHEDTSLVLYS